ncbi:MAG TPA: SAVED domain-containing protein [Planktothrix sp.]
MTKKLIPTLRGDEYQILWFWLQSCKLFNPRTKVVAVEFESNDVKGFDDVVAHFGGLVDQLGRPHIRDCYQIKFHVTGNGSITGKALCDPAFINAETISLLQRLHAAYKKDNGDAAGCSYILLSPWQVHPDDVLAKVFDLSDDSIDWDRLAEGKTSKSATGALRQDWRDHLKLASDEELRQVISRLRLSQTGSIDDLRRRLNENLMMAGLRPIDQSSDVDPYQEVARELLKQGGNINLTRQDAEEICKRKNLYEGPPLFAEDRKYLGVRTFTRWTAGLEDRCEDILDLCDFFVDRKLVAGHTWSDVNRNINEFVDRHAQLGAKLDFELHALLSVSFALGYALPAKRRVESAVIQPPRNRWHSHVPGSTAQDLFIVTPISQAKGGEVAVSLSVTHDASAEVAKFLSTQNHYAQSHIRFSPATGYGSTAVTDGTHAWQLAQSFCTQVKQLVVEHGYTRVHLFSAAPAALLFFIGQLSHALPPVTVYEYEFGAATPTYFAGVEVPATSSTR